jgi:lysophospholipase L1-like esterase
MRDYRLAGISLSRSIYAAMTTSITRNVLTSLILFAACGLQAQSGAHSALIPVPRGLETNWTKRAKLLDERVKDTPDTQVLFIGDSITQGWEGVTGGSNVWKKYYAPRKAVNLGIGGDRTQHVLWRLEKAPLEGVKPKAAVVMIGTNNSNGEDNTPGQIIDGIEAIIKKLRSRLPNTKILLLAIFPRGENFNAQRGKLAQINQILTKFHDGQNIHYLDIGPQFLNRDGILPGEIMPDYLHLSEKGYQIWAEAIEPKLSELLGEKR